MKKSTKNKKNKVRVRDLKTKKNAKGGFIWFGQSVANLGSSRLSASRNIK